MITTKKQIKKPTNLRYGGRTPYGILLLFFLLCTTFGVAQEFRVIDNKGTIRTVTSNSVTTSATAPTSPVEGDVWFDTTTNISKIYDGSNWLTIDPDTVSVTTTTPTTPEEGDIWFDTTNDITKIYDGSAWQEVQAASALALWDKDTDTGIQVEETGDEDKIRFDTKNAERMIIDENGNVGVGTSSPTNTLDVNGKARVRTLTDETSNDTISIVSVNDDGVLSKIERYWKQSDETRTQSSTNLFTSSMTATQSTTYAGNGADRAINGNTSSADRSITGQQVFPWWKLDMGSEITLNRLRFYQFASSQFRLSNFYVIFSKTDINLPATPTQTDVDNLVNNNESVQYSGQIPNQSGDIEFSDKEARYIIVVRNISTADYLQMAEVQGFEDTLSYAGITTDKEKVGIGTSSPSEKLDVDGGARIRTLNAGAAADEIVVADTNGVLKKRSLTDVVQEPWFGDDDDAAATTNTEDIYHMGQVGIGTTDPSDKLHIVGDARITGALKDSNNEAGTSGQILSSTATGTDWIDIATPTALWDADTNTGVQVEESADENKIRFDTNGDERLILDEEGRLLFANPGNYSQLHNANSAVLGIDGTTHGRLRLTAGSKDTFNDTEGASIDLHATSADDSPGMLDLVAGRGASGTSSAIRFFTNKTGATGGQAVRVLITGEGTVGIGNNFPNANAILDLTNSDDKAFLLPTETLPTNISSPTDGMLVYSTDNDNAYLRADSAWKPIAYNAVTNEQIFDGDDDADTSNDDFYYVSMVINGAWKVIRYNKTDVNDEKEATVSNNSGQTTQPTDLATCTGLTYS